MCVGMAQTSDTSLRSCCPWNEEDVYEKLEIEEIMRSVVCNDRNFINREGKGVTSKLFIVAFLLSIFKYTCQTLFLDQQLLDVRTYQARFVFFSNVKAFVTRWTFTLELTLNV